MTIHILRHGLPLCRFNVGLPANWPEGHYWVDKPADANCKDCIRQAVATAAAEASYVDASYDERLCERCAKPYRGPALYCSLVCAVADAGGSSQ